MNDFGWSGGEIFESKKIDLVRVKGGGGGRVLADRSRTTRQRRSQKFNEAETVSIYLFAARRFRGGAAGAPGGGGEEARSENTVSSRSILGTRRARDRERDRDR